MNSFRSVLKKTKMIDRAWCGRTVEKCYWLIFISLLSKYHVCLSLSMLSFFPSLPFEININPLNTGCRLQSPIRVEYKLNQSDTATAASDKSLSNTLMPSNCLWRPLPPCLLFNLDPHPASSQLSPTNACPPLPVSVTTRWGIWAFYPTCHVSARLPSCGPPHFLKKRVELTVPRVCCPKDVYQ